MALVVADELAKRYKRTWALRDVSFALADGGVTALVGPNGAGKSTFIKLCLGFERATRGRALIRGIDPARRPGAAIAAIGYVPQVPTMYRELSAHDHLKLAASLRTGFDIAYAVRRLDDLGIPLDAPPTHLSGGQAAQLWLAVALGTRAPILLLDEPLANLDPLARREFLQVVADGSARDGVTILLSSHVIGDVEPIADRLLLLADGKVLVHDSISAVCGAHRVGATEDATASGQAVASFPDRVGHSLQLRHVAPGAAGAPASLEDVVLGYLASVRPPRLAGVELAGPEGAA
jgi:ABC-2 type transport system ATP-binding protein